MKEYYARLAGKSGKETRVFDARFPRSSLRQEKTLNIVIQSLAHIHSNILSFRDYTLPCTF